MLELRVPRQERARRSRAALVQAGRREFSERGFGHATSRSIAARAGVSTGSFYQYFTDKSALLRELARMRLEAAAAATMDGLEADVTADPSAAQFEAELRHRLRLLGALVLAFKRQDPGLDAVFRERRHADPTLQALWLEGERALLRRIEALLVRWRGTSGPPASAIVLFGLVDGATDGQIDHMQVDDDDFLDTLTDALVRVAFPSQP